MNGDYEELAKFASELNTLVRERVNAEAEVCSLSAAVNIQRSSAERILATRVLEDNAREEFRKALLRHKAYRERSERSW